MYIEFDNTTVITFQMEGIVMLISQFNIEELYKEYKEYCLTIAYCLLGSMTDAEDIVQDTFLKINQFVI